MMAEETSYYDADADAYAEVKIEEDELICEEPDPFMLYPAVGISIKEDRNFEIPDLSQVHVHDHPLHHDSVESKPPKSRRGRPATKGSQKAKAFSCAPGKRAAAKPKKFTPTKPPRIQSPKKSGRESPQIKIKSTTHISAQEFEKAKACAVSLIRIPTPPSLRALRGKLASKVKVEKSSPTKSDIVCDECGKSFTRRAGLNLHIRTIHGKRRSRSHDDQSGSNCSSSDEEESKPRRKSRSKSKVKRTEKISTCPECGRTFTRAFGLKHHLIHVHKLNPAAGGSGGAIVAIAAVEGPNSSGESRESHSSSAHADDDKIPKLELTHRNRSPSSKAGKKGRHDEAAVSTCDKCGKSFTRAAGLRYHLLHVHADPDTKDQIERKHACDVCGKKFLQKSHLIFHGQTHTKIKLFPCRKEGCEKRFPSGSRRKRHEEKCGTEEEGSAGGKARIVAIGRRECQHCGKILKTPSQCRKHEISHTGEKPHRCTYENCDAKYANSISLTEHVRVAHTGELPYKCEEPGCGATFARHLNFKYHYKTKHSAKPKQFTCETCGRAFLQRGDLIRHSSIHTGLKPYLCTTCGMSFRRPYRLRAHAKIHLKPPREPQPKKKRIWKRRPPKTAAAAAAAALGIGGDDGIGVGPLKKRLAPPRSYPCTFDGCNRRFASQKNLDVHSRKHLEPFSAVNNNLALATAAAGSASSSSSSSFTTATPLALNRAAYHPHSSSSAHKRSGGSSELPMYIPELGQQQQLQLRGLQLQPETPQFDYTQPTSSSAVAHQQLFWAQATLPQPPPPPPMGAPYYSGGPSTNQVDFSSHYTASSSNSDRNTHSHGRRPTDGELRKIEMNLAEMDHGTDYYDDDDDDDRHDDYEPSNTNTSCESEYEEMPAPPPSTSRRTNMIGITQQQQQPPQQSVLVRHDTIPSAAQHHHQLTPISSSSSSSNFYNYDSHTYACRICGKRFPDKLHLSSHEMVHSTDPHDGHVIEPPLAIKSLPLSRSAQILAASTVVTPKKPTKTRQQKLECHGPLICHVCGKEFKRRNSLHWHRMVHEPNFHAFTCKALNCNETFKHVVQLRSHMHLAHPNLEGTVGCDHCGMKFPSVTYLDRHIKNIHSNPKKKKSTSATAAAAAAGDGRAAAAAPATTTEDLPCKQCERVFTRKMDLERHMASHDSSVFPFKCKRSDCGQRFQNVTAMSAHVRAEHPDSTLNQCDFCKQSFNSAPSLQSHLRRVHFNTRHICTYPGCSESFKSGRSLRSHVESAHESKGINRYHCELCDRGYTSEVRLQDHKRIVHRPGKTRFRKATPLFNTCTICEKSFARPWLLSRHMITHSEDIRPWKCPEETCPKSAKGFSSMQGLNAHLMRDHGK